MIFQSAMGANVAESVFRSVVSGVTKTSTVAALYKGEPAVLSTATIGVGPLGQEVVRALTSTTVGNAAVVGAVYSDTIPRWNTAW